MKNEHNFNEPKDGLRVSIMSALIALSIAILAVFHDNNIMLGRTIQSGSFVETIINALKLLLCASVISGIIFLLTTGYLYGFNYDGKYDSKVAVIKNLVTKWHSFIFWLHKKSYGFAIGVFVFSFISIIFNIIAKIFGFYGVGSLTVVAVVAAAIIAVILIVVAYEKYINRKSTQK